MSGCMIKPVSGSCQMKCRYCFYKDEMNVRANGNFGTMNEVTVEKLVQKMLSRGEKKVSFFFQGGEPTLAGLDFYRNFLNTVNRHREKGVAVSYSIQTNGYSITPEWAEFFAENKFLVGVSLDGTQILHDKNRVGFDGAGTYARVMKSIDNLKKSGCDYNIVTVVTDETARRVHELYAFYKEQGFVYQQYIPCLSPLCEEENSFLSPKAYFDFLKKLFIHYKQDMTAGHYVYIRRFENWCAMSVGLPPEECGCLGVCNQQILVEADGSVYPCDFYALDGYRIGNIVTDEIDDMLRSDAEKAFYLRARGRAEKCSSCRWEKMCGGGCFRYRKKDGSYPYCETICSFFDFAYRDLQKIYRKWASKGEKV